MAWYTVNIMKGFTVFDVNPNKQFNVEQIAGFRFDNPKIIYSFKKVIANTSQWDGTMTLQGSYPYYTIVTDGTINNSSVINVLVYEE